MQEASALFRQNWSIIEGMARDGIRTNASEGGIITIVMP